MRTLTRRTPSQYVSPLHISLHRVPQRISYSSDRTARWSRVGCSSPLTSTVDMHLQGLFVWSLRCWRPASAPLSTCPHRTSHTALGLPDYEARPVSGSTMNGARHNTARPRKSSTTPPVPWRRRRPVFTLSRRGATYANIPIRHCDRPLTAAARLRRSRPDAGGYALELSRLLVTTPESPGQSGHTRAPLN